MLESGEWHLLEGVETKGNPRWRGLKRVLVERGYRVPPTTAKHDDHG